MHGNHLASSWDDLDDPTDAWFQLIWGRASPQCGLKLPECSDVQPGLRIFVLTESSVDEATQTHRLGPALGFLSFEGKLKTLVFALEANKFN